MDKGTIKRIEKLEQHLSMDEPGIGGIFFICVDGRLKEPAPPPPVAGWTNKNITVHRLPDETDKELSQRAIDAAKPFQRPGSVPCFFQL
jgi:hypothetical protein